MHYFLIIFSVREAAGVGCKMRNEYKIFKNSRYELDHKKYSFSLVLMCICAHPHQHIYVYGVGEE